MPHHFEYDDFSIELKPTAAGGFETRVSLQSGGSAPSPFELPAAFDHVDSMLGWMESAVLLRNVHRIHPEKGPADLEKIGGSLFAALFREGVGEAFREACRLAHSGNRGLRLRLVFDPQAKKAPVWLAALPWEALYDRSNGQFLSQNPRTPVVRYLQRERFDDPRLPPVDEPLRVLVTLSQPTDLAALDGVSEKARIEESFGSGSAERVAILQSPSLADLRAALEQHQPHLLHLTSHGSFDPESGEGFLLLENEGGEADPVTGHELATVIQSCPHLRLVVLNACSTGAMPRHHGLDPFSGVAAALLLRGLPAVVAMQFPISDSAAIVFSGAFYRALADGKCLELALTEGRHAIHDQLRNGEWLTPALYLRAEHGQLFRAAKENKMEEMIQSREALIRRLTTGFVGRQFLFEAIDRFFDEEEQGYFLIEGDPGVGKTAIMAQLVHRRGYLAHFNIRGEPDSNRTRAFLANICAQLIVRYGLPEKAIPPEAREGPAFLGRLLEKISTLLGEDERLVILVDALDEVDDAGTEGNILGLPVHLPKRVYFVLTTRRLPKDEPERWQLRTDCPLKRYALRHDDLANQADAKAYVEQEADLHALDSWWLAQRLDRREFVELFVVLSEGNFRYLHHVLPELRPGGLYRDRLIAQLPQGLEEYYRDHWARMRELCGQDWYEYQLPVLAALTVVQRPIPFELIVYLTCIEQPVRVLTVLLAWEGFFHIEADLSRNLRLQRYRFYHATFIDFVGRQEEVDLTSSTRQMKERLYRDFVKSGA